MIESSSAYEVAAVRVIYAWISSLFRTVSLVYLLCFQSLLYSFVVAGSYKFRGLRGAGGQLMSPKASTSLEVGP